MRLNRRQLRRARHERREIDRTLRRRSVTKGRRWFVRRGLWYFVMTHGRRGLLVDQAGPFATLRQADQRSGHLDAEN